MENKTWHIKYRTTESNSKKTLYKVIGCILISISIILILILMTVGDLRIDNFIEFALGALIGISLLHEKQIMIDKQNGIWLDLDVNNIIKWENVISVEYNNTLNFTIVNKENNSQSQLILIPIGSQSKQDSMEIVNYFNSRTNN